MPLLQPSLCTCYPLKLPSLPANLLDADELIKKKMTLETRTGAAVELARSGIFVHGGLTIPLNLTQVNSIQIQRELMLYFAKEKRSGSLFRKLGDWISSEVFFLDLISRCWKRVDIDESIKPRDIEGNGEKTPELNGRFFHSMSFSDSYLYVFGGLVVSPQNGYELIASNELWKLDLDTKKWSLISKNPEIPRRFGHTMHTRNEANESRDTKLIILGGLNNMDQPLNKVDIYNLTKDCWESIPSSDNYRKFWTNLNGNSICDLKETNFSILIEDNEAKVPTLVLYCVKNEDETQLSGPPLLALPLKPEAKGMPMNSNENQLKSNVNIPYGLRFPSGSFFFNTVVMAGFYPDFQPSNFQCFVYDIHSGKWTKVGTNCEDEDYHKHRFWKLFVWHSHRENLLLGTKDNDCQLPTVQKFDWLLSFGLPMISIYNRLLHSIDHQSTILRPLHNTVHRPQSTSESLDDMTPDWMESGERKLSFASSSTSQFESYIKYIAPPVQMTSISSVFPPYAMVLGKDALEIFGKPLSDFEFITEEGDSIGIPIFLLRKRWGRYFDMLLSQGYAKVWAEYETNGDQSDLRKFSPHSSQTGVSSKRNSGSSTTSESPDKYSKEAGLTDKSVATEMGEEKCASADEGDVTITSAAHEPYENDDDDPMSPPPVNRAGLTGYKSLSSKSIHRIGTASTTSSSGGMIFRVPFQEASTTPPPTDTHLLRSSISQDRRRSMPLVDSPTVDRLKPTSNNTRSQYSRRASHPDTNTIDNGSHRRPSHSSNRHNVSNERGSRNPSITSQGSSISFVSSSSDRMGNSLMPQSANRSGSIGSNFSGILTVPLPPPSMAPDEPLPSIPYDAAGSRRSVSEGGTSNKSSPFSSRRPSFDKNYAILDTRIGMEDFRGSIDSHFFADNAHDSVADNSFHRSILAKLNPKLGETSNSSIRSGGKNPESNRLSLGSNVDSTISVNSTVFEWEPLLTPRTLYMPWPTVTVKAFSEFFYIGQVNGKWSLAPVALNLLVMSKIYEVPLLNDLINEVLYSIIGRKEDSLFVICNSLMEAIKKRLRNTFNEDESWVEAEASNNENYIELERLKHSLESVDNGYVDLDLLKRVSRSLSMSTNESEDFSHDHFSDTHMGSSHIPTVFAGGPRDSHNSIGSIGYPAGVSLQGSRKSSSILFSPRVKKKSSLSKEVNLNKGDNGGHDAGESKESTREGDDNVGAGYSYYDEVGSNYSYTSSDSSISNDEEADDNGKDSEHRDLRPSSTIIDARSKKNEEQEHEGDALKEFQINKDKGGDEFVNDSNSSLSDYDGLSSDLGLLSLNKMKRKLAGRSDLNESVDPLFETESFCQGSGSSHKNSNAKHGKDDFTFSTQGLTLECLVSSNALPPVDYVIKAIYRTAALVNYPRLMIRCLDCIEVSKRLRDIKRRLSQDFVAMDQETKKHADNSNNGSSKVQKSNTEWTSNKPSTSGTASPKMENQRKVTPQASPILSSKSSDVRDDESIKSSASQSKKFLKSKVFSDSSSQQSNTSVFMNPAFIPPPPSSNRNKKNNSNNSGFSFFGMRK